MDRKHFLKLMALGSLIPVLPGLSGCRRDDPLISYNGSVTIIGAGAAGLYAAWLLKNAGATVRILEATDRIGGRIHTLEGFSDFPIELGAEEIHGHKSTWYDIVKDSGATFLKDNTTERFFVDGAVQDLDEITGDDDYMKLRNLIDNLSDYSGADMTMEEYLTQEGIAARVLPLAQAWLGNESGTSNNHFGLKGAAEGDRLWSAGNQNEMVADKGFRAILEEKFASVIPDVILNASVFRIDHTLNTVRCDDLNGNSYESDKVIVTVPLGVLKAKIVNFVPELSFNKLDAINTLGMGPGMKVILKFSNRFWPEETGSIYGGTRVPEYWATAVGRSSTDNILTAFVHGDFAASLSALGSGLVPAVCADLDAMFGGTVATDSLVDSHVEDWGINPYYQGTYSFPTVGSGNARKLLASPIGNKVFFAGEATHTEGHYATVHGALETGYRAAQEVVTS